MTNETLSDRVSGVPAPVEDGVTGDGQRKGSRNSEYESRRRASGLVKVTLWVPAGSKADFEIAARRSCVTGATVAFLRSCVTGRYERL